MSKHNLGIFYFKKALQENDSVCAQLGAGSTDPGEPTAGRQLVFDRLRRAGHQRAAEHGGTYTIVKSLYLYLKLI